MAIYTFNRGDMSLRIRVTDGEPFFQTTDIKNCVGTAKTMIEDYLPKSTWVNYTGLIDAIDEVERGGTGFARKRVNAIHRSRVDRFRSWIEWEVIPQLTKMILG